LKAIFLARELTIFADRLKTRTQREPIDGTQLPQTTLQTRIQGYDEVLDALAGLMNLVERGLHRELCAGRAWTGDLAVSFYKQFGISAKLLESVYAARQAKVDATIELAKLHVQEVGSRHAAKLRQIKKKSASLTRARKKIVETAETVAKAEAKVEKLTVALEKATEANRPKALQQLKSLLGVTHRERKDLGVLVEKTWRLKADLHQHKRRAGNLAHKLEHARKRVDSPALCFGTKKLFKAQFHLEANGLASHELWLESWRKARSATFMIEGAASAPAGNQFVRLSLRKDGLFNLELRLPEALRHLAQESFKSGGQTIQIVRLKGLQFLHRADELTSALGRGIPVAVRFHRDERGWRVMPSFKSVVVETKFDTRCGAIGVDLNAGHVSVTRADRYGNPIEWFDVPLVTYGKSEGQSLDICRKAVEKIVAYAKRHDLPIVCEKLDFSDKKKRLKKDGDARRARQLSSFAYSAFAAALDSACARAGVYLRRVNPAYTSIIGRAKTARRYGSSVHAAASLAIARRAMGLSEQLPRSFIDTRSLQVPMNDAHLVTLDLPARKDPGGQDAGTRHVWSDWNRVVKSFGEALAARRPSKRKPFRSTLGRGELRSMVGRSEGAVPGISVQSRTNGTVRAMTA
jgi:IS605 OrfB family transposase